MNKRMAIFGIVALVVLVGSCAVSRNFFGGSGGQPTSQDSGLIISPDVKTANTPLNPTNVSLVFSRLEGGRWTLVALGGQGSDVSTRSITWGGPHLLRVSGPYATAIGSEYGFGKEPGRSVVNWTTGKRVFPMPASQSDWPAAGSGGRAALVLKGVGQDVLLVMPDGFSFSASAIMSPVFGPEGALAAAVRNATEAPWQIVVFQQSYTGSTEPRPIWPSGYDQAFPSFSPDGKRLIFAGKDGRGNWGLYLVDSTTVAFSAQEPRQILAGTLELGQVVYPSWGPDGWVVVTICRNLTEDFLCEDGKIWLVKFGDDPNQPATAKPVAPGVAASWLWPEFLQTTEVEDPSPPPPTETPQPTGGVWETSEANPAPTATPAGQRFVRVTWSRGEGLSCHSSLDTLEWNRNVVDNIPVGTVVEVFDTGHAPVKWVNPEQPDDPRTQEALLVEYLFFKCWIRSNATRECPPGKCPL